jgi:hypothetical protein
MDCGKTPVSSYSFGNNRPEIIASSTFREDMADLELAEPPHIDFETSDKHIEMEVTLDLSGLVQASSYEVAFSAVISDKSGGKSYWALSHPQAKPDFHHEGSFTHQLKAADSL